MSQPRVSLWATEEIDEDLQVDVNLAIGNYGQNGSYDDGAYIPSIFFGFFLSGQPRSFLRIAAQPRIDEATLVAVQHQMAQQAAFAQIPDAVKRVRIIHLDSQWE
jgi:translation initiation factor 3 subunit L